MGMLRQANFSYISMCVFVNQIIYIFVCLFVCLFFSLSCFVVRVLVCLFVRLFVCLFACFFLLLSLFGYLFLSLLVWFVTHCFFFKACLTNHAHLNVKSYVLSTCVICVCIVWLSKAYQTSVMLSTSDRGPTLDSARNNLSTWSTESIFTSFSLSMFYYQL